MRPRLAAPSLPREIPPETPLAPPPRGEKFSPSAKIFPPDPQSLTRIAGEIFAPGLGGSARARYLRVRFRVGTGGRKKRGGPGGAAFVGAWRCEGPAGPGPGGPGAAGTEEKVVETIISKGEFDPGSG